MCPTPPIRSSRAGGRCPTPRGPRPSTTTRPSCSMGRRPSSCYPSTVGMANRGATCAASRRPMGSRSAASSPMGSRQPTSAAPAKPADTLEVDKAAVHRHLQKLGEGELVKRYEDHGFVYYGLSWKSRDLLSPTENTKIIVLLGTFFWAGIGGDAPP